MVVGFGVGGTSEHVSSGFWPLPQRYTALCCLRSALQLPPTMYILSGDRGALSDNENPVHGCAVLSLQSDVPQNVDGRIDGIAHRCNAKQQIGHGELEM